MPIRSVTYQEIILQELNRRGTSLSPADFYAAVETVSQFDEDDTRPPTLRGEPVNEPSWRRNVRNALQSMKNAGRIVNVEHDRWRLPSPNPGLALSEDDAWSLVHAAAARAMRLGEVFHSAVQEARYKVEAVENARLLVKRLDATENEVVTSGEVLRSVRYLNAAGGRSGRRTLNYTVAKESAIVHLHPELRWSEDRLWVEVRGAAGTADFPDETSATTFVEGAGQTVIVNRYERSRAARDACIAHFGTRCQVCGLDFAEVYGPLGAGLIHVHHLRSISSVGETYVVNPLEDLRPVCPNCHAMLHQRSEPLKIEELKALLRNTPAGQALLELMCVQQVSP